MKCSLATESTAPLEGLWSLAVTTVADTRGGEALLATISGGVPLADLLGHLICGKYVWTGLHDEELMAFAIVRHDVIEALYVPVAFRRRGVARSMLESLHALAQPPIDALALPGDRGTKSLYESFGWKARLLTMRAD